MANTKKQKQLMVAKESFAVMKDGTPRVITPDMPLWDNDPIVKKHRELFESLQEQVSKRGAVVHTATAVPGEVRADVPDVPDVPDVESVPETRACFCE